MSLIADRVFETTDTQGQGPLTLIGAQPDFRGFRDAFANGDRVLYVIEQAGAGWEVGLGTLSVGVPDTLSRDTVLSSSNANALVNFGAGTKNVFVAPAGAVVRGALSTHWGPAAPPWAVDGTQWVDTSATPHVWRIRQDAAWIDIGIIDPTVGAFKASAGLPPGHISGLVASNNVTDSEHDLDFSAGKCRYGNDAGDYALSLPLTKQMDVPFAQGSGVGGLGNTVTLPADGTLHCFAITRDADGTVDVYGDTSFAGSNVPAGWTIRRRIDSVVTDAVNNIRRFHPLELAGGAVEKLLDAPPTDLDTTNHPTGYTLQALTVPGGFPVRALLTFRTGGSNGGLFYVRTPGVLGETTYGFMEIDSAGDESMTHPYPFRTNSARQIEIRANVSFLQMRLATRGWIDERR